MDLDYKEIVDGVIKKYDGKKEAIIGILQDVQAQLRWLPSNVLSLISERLKISLSSIYSIATFYKSFHLKSRGENVVTVCMGTACHVRGAQKILDELKRTLDINEGETTKDSKFTLERVNCLGCCAIGPIVVVNEEYHGGMDSQKAKKLIENLEKGSNNG